MTGAETLVIRADANTRIGSGHLMRSLALAEAWRAGGGGVCVVSQCDAPALRARIEQAGVRFLGLECTHPDRSDLQQTLCVLRDYEAHWLALDGYHFDAKYQQAVRAAGARLLVIDDTAHLPEYHANVLLNQNINAQALSYRCAPDTIRLLGPRYALLRSEFRACSRRGEAARLARNVLITLGGGDPDNVTLKVVRGLHQVEMTGLNVQIVIGASNPHETSLRDAISTLDWSPQRAAIHLRRDALNMPQLMAWADVAVSAAGSTCWELAFMGVPSVLLVVAANQQRIAEGLAEMGLAINLGWFEHVSVPQIATTLTHVFSSCEWRCNASSQGRHLVDGQGSARVTRALRTFASLDGLTARLATMNDAESLWRLANDPDVRRHAFHPEPIQWECHVEWIRRKLSSSDSRIWLLELDGDLVAQVRYDRTQHGVAEIDFAVVPAGRGLGIGTRALALTCRPACDALGVRLLRGVVLESNPSSLRAFEKAGFTRVAHGTSMHGRSCSIFECSCDGMV